ncbi:MAG: hypothetical protein ABJD68_07145, partial [Nakamurella sp.]
NQVVCTAMQLERRDVENGNLDPGGPLCGGESGRQSVLQIVSRHSARDFGAAAVFCAPMRRTRSLMRRTLQQAHQGFRVRSWPGGHMEGDLSQFGTASAMTVPW